MTAISIETTLTAEHHLNIELPPDFPQGPVIVKVESVPPATPKAFEPQTELGKQLLQIRQRAIAKGMQLKTTDEILAELRADRGEQDNDANVR